MRRGLINILQILGVSSPTSALRFRVSGRCSSLHSPRSTLASSNHIIPPLINSTDLIAVKDLCNSRRSSISVLLTSLISSCLSAVESLLYRSRGSLLSLSMVVSYSD
ncbi:hypothetical protein GGR54DRAFT_478505 [Hypoxylon sp. NC1633]|nr:hypothetical protein GGR54DRAFT_478505 [Hypoxylon sp. NC1633]